MARMQDRVSDLERPRARELMAVDEELEGHEHQPLLDELYEEIARHNPDPDRGLIEAAFGFAADAHRTQVRQSGESFITHPMGCARICAQLGLDSQVIAAALLHDTVEDTSATLEEVETRFGAEVAALVDGVTKLSKMQFSSNEEAQAETYRKMVVAMAKDIRVILVKLADRLHNMRTLDGLGKQKQIQKAKETLEIYAPLAHRLGIQSLKWELEDLSFKALHPRKYQEIAALVSQRRADRERYISDAGQQLAGELTGVGIEADITGRAKHYYSIYVKMARRGKEFNEIYDLTALRVLVDSVQDCYGAIGTVHSTWKPLPGRFKDYVAMPKSNLYQSLHTTVIGPEGKPLEIQIRTFDMHRTAEFGIAAHWLYKTRNEAPAAKGSRKGFARRAKERAQSDSGTGWLGNVIDWQRETADPRQFMESLKIDLFDDEVFVFTPKGEVKSLAAGATPLDFAYSVHTDVGHRCVGAKVNGRIVPLTYPMQSGDIVEVLTSKAPRGPSLDWLGIATTTRARNKIRAWFKAERREDSEHLGRTALQEHLTKAGMPAQKIAASSLLASVIREMGFRKAEEFYVALGSNKITASTVVNKVLQKLKTQALPDSGMTPTDLIERKKTSHGRQAVPSAESGISVDGLAPGEAMVRLAACCKPVPGDAIVGYISLGKGIAIHRDDCPNLKTLRRSPERFTPVTWEGGSKASFRIELQVDGWDRPRMLEDLARTCSEHGVNILNAQCNTSDAMIRNRFTVEIGDAANLKPLVASLRNVTSVFDAYRVTPGA